MIKLFNGKRCATVAQLVEQLIRNQQVAGSSPASSSKKRRYVLYLLFLYVSKIWTDLRVGAVLWEQNALPSKKLGIENVCGKVGN